MVGLIDTENLQEAFRALRVFLGFVFMVGWLASTLLFWFLIFDFLSLGKRKVVEVEVDGVSVPVPCKKEMVSLVVPFFFLAVSLVFFFFSYLLMPSDWEEVWVVIIVDAFIFHWSLRLLISSFVFFLCGYILLCFSKSVLRAWPSLREMPWYIVVDLVCVVIFSIFFFYNFIASILSLFGLALPGNLTSLLYQW
jgi:hypothetical protein